MAKLTETVSFDFIRYANCWEDADILLKGLDVKENAKILSIASAGDNSFSLLVTNPKLVVAVDVNIIQLYLVELKKIAIQNLDYEEIIEFLGFRKSENRLIVFNKLKDKLSENTRKYWEENCIQIENGVINQGKFERYFQKFCRYILPLIHRKKTIEKLLSPKTEQQQIDFYENKWNTWRWRLLFKIFFSRFVMGRYGRDPEFLRQVNVSVGDFIFQRAEKQLKSTFAQKNFILRYNLTGSFGTLLPHYLQKDTFEVIKKNISQLVVYEGFAEDAIAEFGNFDCMNLSNIFEYMNDELFQKTATALVNGLNKNGRMAYWNLMVFRSIANILTNEVALEKELSTQLSDEDKGFFYGAFFINQKIN